MEFFIESRKRIERAGLHLVAFGDEWKRVLNPDSYQIVTEINSDWTSGFTKAIPTMSLENTMAAELGEFFYHLQAALDSLIYHAAIFLEGSDPPPNEKSIYFPVCAKRSTFKDAAVSKSPFPQELTDWLDSIQPYIINEVPNAPQRPLIEMLMLIHACANRDRHRRFHIVAAVPMDIDFRTVFDPPTARVVNAKAFKINVLEDEGPFFAFELVGANSQELVKVHTQTAVTFDVSLDQIPLPAGGRLDEELKKMIDAVSYIVRYFEDGFLAGLEWITAGN